MKYTLNETSFQPSLSANIQIYQIFEKKGNPSPIFFARQRARAEKPRESLIRSRPRYAALERREKEGGGSLPLPRMNTRFRTLPRYTNFFFFLFFSLGHLMVMCATIGRIYSSWRKPRSSFLFSTMKLKVSCWRHE